MNDKNAELNASSKNISRRQFAKTAALVAVSSAPLIAVSAQTPTPTPAKEPAAPPNPQTSPTPQPVSPVVLALGALVEARFGKFLSAEELVKVKDDMTGNARTAERLGAAKLQNSDEPDFVFAA